MTAKEICALAFDEAGITFAEDAKGGNKSFYKGQMKKGGFDGSQKADKEPGGEEPFDLQKHDEQHHEGHYDGGKCKYRDDAVKKGLITPEQAAQKTGQQNAGVQNGEQGQQQQGQQQEEGKEPPQITPEQLLNQFKEHPESISGAKEGQKTEPQQTETPVGPITTESPVQEAVVKGLSEEAEAGNPEAVKVLNNLKDFNDLKEEIGAFQRMEGESIDDYIDRFNQVVAGIDPEKFDEKQKAALTALAQMQQTRIEQEVGRQAMAERTQGAAEPEAPQQTNRPQVAGRASRRVNPETGLFEYTGPDGKTYVDVSGLGAFEAMQAAMKATATGKEFLDKWDKYSGKWQQIMDAHQTDSTADQNRRASVNAVAGATMEDESLRIMKNFAEQKGLSPMDRQDAMNRIALYEAASGNIEKQTKLYSQFSKWSKSINIENVSGNDSDLTVAELNDAEKNLYEAANELPTLQDIGLKEGDEVEIDPRAKAFQEDVGKLDHALVLGYLTATEYDEKLAELKKSYVESGYNPDPPKQTRSGWTHNIPHQSIFHDISNDEARAIITKSCADNLDSTFEDLGITAHVEGEPRIDSNETTYFVKLDGTTQAKNVKQLLDSIKNKMGEPGIRLDQVVSGKPGYVAVHMPSYMQDIVGFGKFFDDPETKKKLETAAIPIPVGLGPGQKMIVNDIASSPTPHALVCGATKSGKSVQGHNMMASWLMKGKKNCVIRVIDPKGQEFNMYDGIDGVSYSTNAEQQIRAALADQDERRKLLKAAGCRNIQEFNEKYPDHPMPYEPILFDEMTQALSRAGGPKSQLAKDIATLTRLARDTGISVIGLAQNADVESLPSEMTNQMGFRMTFRMQNADASRKALSLTAKQNGGAAADLKGYGDGLIKNEDDTLSRFQSAFIPPKDIEKLITWRKERDSGLLESLKRTPDDIANEEREARFQQTQREQREQMTGVAEQPGQPKNYTVDVSRVGNDPSTALQMTASSIISDAKNLSKTEALGHLNQAYQHYLGSIPEGEGRDKLATAYNTLKSEMAENKSNHPYKPDAPSQTQAQTGETSGQNGGEERSPKAITPEELVSPEEAQQIAQKAADKKKFDDTHAKYHPTDQKGEEALEDEMYNESVAEIYKSHEAGKLTGEKFRKKLAELDEGHKQRRADIADKYKAKEQPAEGQNEASQQGQQQSQQTSQQQGQQQGQSNSESDNKKDDGVDKGDDTDPLAMFTNETDDQRQQRAKDDYRKTATQIRDAYKSGKITFEEAQKQSQKAQEARDKLMKGGKSDEEEAKEKAKAESENEAKLRSTIKTDDGHGKIAAHSIPGKGRGAKGATTPLSFADHQALTKALPKDFVLEGGNNPVRDGNGNIWAHHKGGQGNGSYGWFDRNNQWHYYANTTHPAYKGEMSPEAQAAKQAWINPKTPMNKTQEAQARKNYMNLAFGHDEALPGFGLDCIDKAILDYFRHEV